MRVREGEARYRLADIVVPLAGGEITDETARQLVVLTASALGFLGFLALAMLITQPVLAGKFAIAAEVSFFAPWVFAFRGDERFARCERRHRTRWERMNCRRGVHDNEHRPLLIAFALVTLLMVYAAGTGAWPVIPILLLPQGLFLLAARARWPVAGPSRQSSRRRSRTASRR